jgi:hypothetical protein
MQGCTSPWLSLTATPDGRPITLLKHRSNSRCSPGGEPIPGCGPRYSGPRFRVAARDSGLRPAIPGSVSRFRVGQTPAALPAVSRFRVAARSSCLPSFALQQCFLINSFWFRVAVRSIPPSIQSKTAHAHFPSSALSICGNPFPPRQTSPNRVKLVEPPGRTGQTVKPIKLSNWAGDDWVKLVEPPTGQTVKPIKLSNWAGDAGLRPSPSPSDLGVAIADRPPASAALRSSGNSIHPTTAFAFTHLRRFRAAGLQPLPRALVVVDCPSASHFG